MTMPQDLCDMTLEALRAAREAMMSADWQLEMDSAAPDIRRESGLLLGRVQGEILRLENAQLAEITSALAANGARLEAAVLDVRKELKKIAHIAKILKKVDLLVGLAIKIVPKAMGYLGPTPSLPSVPLPEPEPEPEPVPGTLGSRRMFARPTAPKVKKKAAAKAKSQAKPKAKAKAKAKAKSKSKPKSKPKPKAKSAAKPKRKAGSGRRAR